MSENEEIWNKLYSAAKSVQKPRQVSTWIEAGQVAAAIMTKNGNIYTGICIDTACSLGMCAERNAIANMLTNGDQEIQKLVVIMPDGKLGLPCGACFEFIMQLQESAGSIELLTDKDTFETKRLKDIFPNWWA